MDLIAWLVAGGSLVLGALITWYFSWKYGNRRRKLLFTWDSVQLMPHNGPASGALEVFYEGTPVKDPYLLSITLKNLGPSDIGLAHYNGHLRLNIPGGLVALMDTEMGAAGAVLVDPEYLEFEPVMLARNSTINVDVLVDGPRTPELVSKILDTDVVATDPKLLAAELLESKPFMLSMTAGSLGIGMSVGSAARQIAKQLRR